MGAEHSGRFLHLNNHWLMGRVLLVCARPVVTQCLEMCPIKVFDGIRLGGGRQDNQSVFSPPPGLTASLMKTLMALIWPNNKIVCCHWCWREWPTQWHRCVPKRTESWLCWTIQRQQVSWQISIFRWFFIRLNQLNISTQGKSKIFLDVSTVQEIVAFNGKIQLWIYRIESGKIAAFLALNAFAEEIEIDLCCTPQIFLARITTSLRVR